MDLSFHREEVSFKKLSLTINMRSISRTCAPMVRGLLRVFKKTKLKKVNDTLADKPKPMAKNIWTKGFGF